MSRIFYCEACKKVVDPIVGTLVEMLDDMHDRRPSCQVSDRNLCPHCSDPVDEIVACIECKEAAPEDGADHCTACLNAELVTNKTGAYLKFHADMERDSEFQPQEKAA